MGYIEYREMYPLRLAYRMLVFICMISLALAGPLSCLSLAEERPADDDVTVYVFTRVNGEYTDDVAVSCAFGEEEMTSLSQAMSVFNESAGLDHDGPGACAFTFNGTNGTLSVSATYFGLNASVGPLEVNDSYVNVTIDLNGNLSDAAVYYVYTMIGGVMANGVTVSCEYDGKTYKRVSRDMSVKDAAADIDYDGPGVCKFVLPVGSGPALFRVIHGGESYVDTVDKPAAPSVGQVTFELPYIPPPDGTVVYVFTRVNGEFINDVRVSCEQGGVQYEDYTKDMSVLEHWEMIEHDGPGACKFILPAGSGDIRLSATYMGVKEETVIESPGTIGSHTFYLSYVPGKPSPSPVPSPSIAVSPTKPAPSMKTPSIDVPMAAAIFLIAGMMLIVKRRA